MTGRGSGMTGRGSGMTGRGSGMAGRDGEPGRDGEVGAQRDDLSPVGAGPDIRTAGQGVRWHRTHGDLPIKPSFDSCRVRSYTHSIVLLFDRMGMQMLYSAGLTFRRHVEQMFGISEENRYSLLSTQELGHGRSSDGGNRQGRRRNRRVRHGSSGST